MYRHVKLKTCLYCLVYTLFVLLSFLLSFLLFVYVVVVVAMFVVAAVLFHCQLLLLFCECRFYLFNYVVI